MADTQHGARWLRCDLHVHTPFDTEKKFGVDVKAALDAFKKHKTEKLAAIAEDFVTACRAAANGAGLNVVALTDHNSIDGYRRLKPFFDAIGQQATDKHRSMIAILPGVEFSVGGERPLHMLVIFASETNPEDVEGAIRYVFGTGHWFDPQKGTPCATGQSVDDFLRRLYDFCQPATGERHLDFVVLPAHADGNSGVLKETGGDLSVATTLWDEMKGHLRERVVTRQDWHGFQARKPYAKLPRLFQDLLARWMAARTARDWDRLSKPEQDAIRRQEHWPLIEASDPHNYENVGSRFTWLKMEVPDVEGIRLALLDPESRLRRMADGPPGQRYPRIERVQIRNTDFFEDIEIPFSPSLTTLIGGRGSGKSTIIELVRYALDRNLKDDYAGQEENNIQEAVASLLKQKKERDFGQSAGSLLPEHEILVDVYVAGRSYRVCRSSRTLEVTPDPDQAGAAPADLEVRALLRPRLLSQRQISQIARDPSAQRRELDELIDEDLRREFEDQRSQLIERIGRAQAARGRAEKRAASLPAQRTELQKVNDQIAFLEAGDRKETFDLFQRFERERRWLREVDKLVDDVTEELRAQAGKLQNRFAGLSSPPEGGTAGEWLASVDVRIRQAVEDAVAVVQAEADKLRVKQDEIRGEKETRWTPGFEASQKSYEALKEDLEQKGVAFGQHRKLVQQRAMLEKDIAELAQADQALSRIRKELMDARDALAQLHERRLELRREKAQALEDTDADVRLELQAFRDEGQLDMALHDWFVGTGLRESDRGVLRDFVFSVGGSVFQRIGALAEALRADARTVETQGSLGSDLMTHGATATLLGEDLTGQLTGHFPRCFQARSRPRFDEMERFVPEDRVRTKVRAADGGFTPITQGSLGQRSTAILSLLLSAGDQPLIIDQPEDDLDNKYIYDVVVDLLRKRKFSRQIVVATHNANIPVNGDAELIVALEVRDGERLGTVAAKGSIDRAEVKEKVSVIMEGSREAFRLRRERYGY